MPEFAQGLGALAGAADLLSLQRTAGNRAVDRLLRGRVPSAAEAVIRDIGRPLDLDTRSVMEAQFGHDFSRVRVHDDNRAAESAESLAARAYTVDRHLVFGRGRYAPSTREGRRLIAHELAHVVQQSGIRGGSTDTVAAEGEAAGAATAVGSIQGAAVSMQAPVGVQREPLSDAEIAQLDDESQIRARLLQNETEYQTLAWGPDMYARLEHENVQLKNALSRVKATPTSASSSPPVDKEGHPVITVSEMVIKGDPNEKDEGDDEPQPSQAIAAPTLKPTTPKELEDKNTSWGFLGEEGLGSDLLQRAAGGDYATVGDTFDAIGDRHRDDVALHMVTQASDDQLEAMAKTDEGAKLLRRVYSELTSAWFGTGDKGKQAARVSEALKKRIHPQKVADAPQKAMVIPFSGVGLTKFSSASISARLLPNGKIEVRSYMRVDDWKHAQRLPSAAFAAGLPIELDPDQMVGIYFEDEGGEPKYIPATELLRMSNQETKKVKEMAAEAVVTGLTLGVGGEAVAAVESVEEAGAAVEGVEEAGAAVKTGRASGPRRAPRPSRWPTTWPWPRSPASSAPRSMTTGG